MVERVKSLGSPRTHEIILGLFSNPIVNVARLSKKLGVTYPTAKNDIERLVKAKILQKLEGTATMTYYSEEVMAVAYGTEELD